MVAPIGDPFIALLDRSIQNLEFMDDSVRDGLHEDSVGNPILFEVTQTINCCLGALVLPWEQIFIPSKLAGVSNKSLELAKLGFPYITHSCGSDEKQVHLGGMLENMRHGLAHGGITILSLRDFQSRFPDAPTPLVAHDHIAAIEIFSKHNNGKGPRKWGCVLTVHEMKQLLCAVQALTREEEFVRPAVWERQQEFKRYERFRA